MFIESEEGNYLFDTGRGFSIVHNALYYEKNFSSIKKIFLGHRYLNHTGGLPFIFQLIPGELEVIAHPHIFLNPKLYEEFPDNFLSCGVGKMLEF